MRKCSDSCEKCIKITQNISDGKWYHYGSITNDLNVGDKGNLYDLIGKPKENTRDVCVGKPSNVFWASAGNWLVDPYHEGHDMDMITGKCLQLIPTDNAKVLRIKNSVDFTNFNDKYIMIYDWMTYMTENSDEDMTVEERINCNKEDDTYVIDWEQVFKEYDAIQIDFCKTNDIGLRGKNIYGIQVLM